MADREDSFIYEWDLRAEHEEIQIKNESFANVFKIKREREITESLKVVIVHVADNRSTEPYIFCTRVVTHLTFPAHPNTLAITVPTQQDECVMAKHVQFLQNKLLVIEFTKTNAIRLLV